MLGGNKVAVGSVEARGGICIGTDTLATTWTFRPVLCLLPRLAAPSRPVLSPPRLTWTGFCPPNPLPCPFTWAPVPHIAFQINPSWLQNAASASLPVSASLPPSRAIMLCVYIPSRRPFLSSRLVPGCISPTSCFLPIRLHSGANPPELCSV